MFRGNTLIGVIQKVSLSLVQMQLREEMCSQSVHTQKIDLLEWVRLL